MESSIGLFKAECIRTTVFHTGPYKTLADVEYATAGWVDWYNNRRLHGSIGMVPPSRIRAKPTTLAPQARDAAHMRAARNLGRFTTELGRHPSARLAQAIKIRAGTCRHPTCTVPADRCDLDHHQPWPHGPTSATNMDPLCRRHHRAKTFAWLATLRSHNSIDWTMPDAEHYRCIDDPLPTGRAA